MNNYIIVTDSCSDLPVEIIKKYNIKVYPMEYVINNTTYHNNPDHSELPLEEFYSMLKKGASGSTSQISPANFIKFFKPILEEGKDILYIAFSSALSGTYNSSLVAKAILKNDYKERQIECVDTLTASTAEGKLVYEACLNKEKGLTLKENAQDILNKRLSVSVWFTVDDLNCLKRGGRLSATSAFLGTLLSIKPVLHVSNEGKLVPINKCRGRKASLLKLFERLKDTGVDIENDTIFISHAACQDDANRVEEKIRNELNAKNVVISTIGPVIGMHSGPGTFLITFFATQR